MTLKFRRESSYGFLIVLVVAAVVVADVLVAGYFLGTTIAVPLSMAVKIENQTYNCYAMSVTGPKLAMTCEKSQSFTKSE